MAAERPTGDVTPPSSTYRFQIRSRFTLAAAAELTDYLRELGAGAVYLSPILQATSGSDHGYDLTDHRRVDPARGGEADRVRLVEAARAQGLAVVVDIVPNHMGVAVPAENEAWWQLLRLGSDSDYADWFDIDWEAGRGRLLLPVLGDEFDDSELSIADGELRYYDHRFPLAPDTWTEGDDPSEVHDRQHYRLVSYRLADTVQNYRRFFAVTDLAGIRVENLPVYQASHAEILRWVQTGTADGIRIDHPDGLADPAGYLQRLAADAPDQWITVEKILEPGERLPADWPVAGTTGYDALTEVNTLLYNPADEDAASTAYRELTGDDRDWNAHVEQGKRLIASTILQAELRRIGRVLTAAGVEGDPVPALTELAVAFAVYRSYQPVGAERLADAVELATARKPELATSISRIQPLLAGGDREATVRFEQATGAIMAKGVEDTAYYRYNRAVGLNEVGGDPGQFGGTVAGFHRAQQIRQAELPASMTTLSTHDTKRSEDVRARLAVLPELGQPWYDTAARLLRAAPIPDRNFGYLLWQTFVGAGFIGRDRMHAYAEKAMREAAEGTGWRDPDQAFEQAVHTAVDRGYDDPDLRADLQRIIDTVEPHGWSNSLAGKLVQLTMPGVPDVYQGTELFDYSLVDPDNRRPVDFEVRRELVRAGEPPELDGTGAAKLWLVRQALTVRRDRPELFTGYRPIETGDEAGEHLVGFDRGGALTLATRLPLTLDRNGGWADAQVNLPASVDVLTGRPHHGDTRLAEVFRRYPVALLIPA